MAQLRKGLQKGILGKFSPFFFIVLCFATANICSPTLLHAQGRIPVVKNPPPDSAKTPAGNATRLGTQTKSGNDTLKGGDGFVPRTVIDSFPRMEGVGRPANSSVTRSQIDAAKRQIAALREKIVMGDSLVAIRRMDPLPDWPKSRIDQLADALSLAKKQLGAAEIQLSNLEKRYNAAIKAAEMPAFPAKSESAIQPKAVAPNPSKPAPAAPKTPAATPQPSAGGQGPPK